jgi:hypothetical protein
MTGRHAVPEPGALLDAGTEARIIAERAKDWIACYDLAELAQADPEVWNVLLGRARALIAELARG